ncbi:hypothetical protein [Caldicellulosiruptor saccharolyticus]|uniref:hypothetical protein n=1 Tax=Caldicellulosiruptor saccharolyticus TaxID=44001 RepID=UPI0003078A7F|nr:hypothetical protein [Caldicellulosiruptor saccharolyticus]
MWLLFVMLLILLSGIAAMVAIYMKTKGKSKNSTGGDAKKKRKTRRSQESV